MDLQQGGDHESARERRLLPCQPLQYRPAGQGGSFIWSELAQPEFLEASCLLRDVICYLYTCTSINHKFIFSRNNLPKQLPRASTDYGHVRDEGHRAAGNPEGGRGHQCV